jgi:hypothetical protein
LGDFDAPYILPPTTPDSSPDVPDSTEHEPADVDVEDQLDIQEDIQDFAFLATLKSSTSSEGLASSGEDGLDGILFASDASSPDTPGSSDIGADIQDEDVEFDDSLFGHVDIEAGENAILKYDEHFLFFFS